MTSHLLVDGHGMPLPVGAIAASGSERDQFALLFHRVRIYHGYERPKQCPREIHASKGYDSPALRVFLQTKVSNL